jgi:hypothetical protein
MSRKNSRIPIKISLMGMRKPVQVQEDDEDEEQDEELIPYPTP